MLMMMMTSTLFALVVAIALSTVHSQQYGDLELSEVRPCIQSLDECRQHIAQYATGVLDENIATVRSTRASVICRDWKAYWACVSNVLSQAPCNRMDHSKAGRERTIEVLDQFCDNQLEDLEENKNCFVDEPLIRAAISCQHKHPNGPRKCNLFKMLSCLESAIRKSRQCGPNAIPLFRQGVEATLYISGLKREEVCSGPGGTAQDWHHLLMDFFMKV
jgi:hypothetical protein